MPVRKQKKRKPRTPKIDLSTYIGDGSFLAVCRALFVARGNRQKAAEELGVARQHLIGTLFGRYPAAPQLFPATAGRPRRLLGSEADADHEYAATTAVRGAALGIPADFLAAIARRGARRSVAA